MATDSEASQARQSKNGAQPKTIFKTTKLPFTMVANHLARDPRLKAEDKGVMVWALSMPDDWNFRTEHARLELGMGREKFFACINRLIAAGYCRRGVERDDKGRIVATSYTFTQTPGDFGDVETPQSENPTMDRPQSGKPPAVQPPPENQHPTNKYRSTKKYRKRANSDFGGGVEPARPRGTDPTLAQAARSLIDAAVKKTTFKERRWKASAADMEEIQRLANGSS